MHSNRAGERGDLPTRQERFFITGDSWYFSTREGCPIGPYPSKDQAGQGLSDFLEFMSLAKPKMLTRFYSSLAKDIAYN